MVGYGRKLEMSQSLTSWILISIKFNVSLITTGNYESTRIPPEFYLSKEGLYFSNTNVLVLKIKNR